MELLRFDNSVEQFTPQPLTIEFVDQSGKSRTYTPDGLIQFKPTIDEQPLPVLFEIKYRADFRKDWKALLPKFRAAKDFCFGRGWRFEVFTEREIRTPYLDNVKFLWPYKNRFVSPEIQTQVLETLWDLDEADPDFLLCALCKTPSNRAMLIPAIWHMIATGSIGCDLNAPLTMRSPIWAEQDC
ncbi:MAG: heteromeric transposase endonuclease subunit TnsA [Burkholderiaceae bacterium]|nr:heteromeric transposase endonuclease subunit TnsA [Burkholderiaceae bacterium]